jgi:heterodisulfide reductase subunit A-like polyferredoxin
MRSSLRKKHDRTTPRTDAALDAAQYCAFCATTMPFERIEPSDYLVDEPDEWICTKCGSALLVDPPTQELNRTA